MGGDSSLLSLRFVPGALEKNDTTAIGTTTTTTAPVATTRTAMTRMTTTNSKNNRSGTTVSLFFVIVTGISDGSTRAFARSNRAILSTQSARQSDRHRSLQPVRRDANWIMNGPSAHYLGLLDNFGELDMRISTLIQFQFAFRGLCLLKSEATGHVAREYFLYKFFALKISAEPSPEISARRPWETKCRSGCQEDSRR